MKRKSLKMSRSLRSHCSFSETYNEEIYAKINVDSGTSDAANSNGYNTYFGGFKIS